MESFFQHLPRLRAACQRASSWQWPACTLPSSSLACSAGTTCLKGQTFEARAIHTGSKLHASPSHWPKSHLQPLSRPEILSSSPTRFSFHLGIRLFHNERFAGPWLAHRAPRENNSAALLVNLITAHRATRTPPSRFTALSSLTRGHATASNRSRAGSLSTHTTANAIMADRNILPDHFKVIHYDIVLTDLDFKNWTYDGTVTYVHNIAPP